MNTPTIPKPHKKRLQAHFALTGLPFRKNVQASRMFDSTSQRELIHGLHMWLEVGGLALVTGPSGAGKSITLRRFARELPTERYNVMSFRQIPTTPAGFLRALSRRLGLRPRLHSVDMFDSAREHLTTWRERDGKHPILVLDDAEGMSAATLDILRRLAAADDIGVVFSVLLIGTEQILKALRLPNLEPLRNRFVYAEALRPFSVEDTRNYIRFHLEQSGARGDVLSDGAATALFNASQGVPRAINQLALQALFHAAIRGLDAIDGNTMKRVIHAHPLYSGSGKQG